ncbi:MAG TPA: hypothetical protein VFM68_02170 [Candidatus Saccharimonadales bacterium]|nr:hypothetical protein [Candidatus Saccharimonadales bacterium]
MKNDQNQQTTKVRETNDVEDGATIRRQTIDSTEKVGTGVIVRRIIYYIAGFIVALLSLRILLLLLAANQNAPFVEFIYNLSAIFAWPFFGIFSYQPTYGQSVLEISSIVAVIVYGLGAMGLAKLFTLTSKRTDV